MTSPKLFTFVDQEMIDSGCLEDQLKEMQDELFTGIARFAAAEHDAHFGLFTRGQLVTLYNAKTDKLQRMYPKTWLDLAGNNSEDMTFQTLNLNVQDLRVLKIILESSENKLESILEVDVEIKSAMAKASPSVLVVNSAFAQSFLYIPGKERNCSYNLFLSAERFVRSVSNGLYAAEEEIQWQGVTTISSDENTLAWSEMHFHNLFNDWLIKLFSVYESLKGRLYLNQIIKSINFKATANDWMLSVNARNVNDQILFNTPKEAVEVFSQLLNVATSRFIADIGEVIFTGIKGDFAANLTSNQAKLFESLTKKAQ